MHNCIWNHLLFQPCRASFRASTSCGFVFFVVFIFLFWNKRWDLKRETIQSSADHLSPCQNVLRSLSAGTDSTFETRCLVSSITRCVSSLYSCVRVITPYVWFFCLFVCFFIVTCTFNVECRTVYEPMPGSRLLSVPCLLCPVLRVNQLCTIAMMKLNRKQASPTSPLNLLLAERKECRPSCLQRGHTVYCQTCRTVTNSPLECLVLHLSSLMQR